MKLQMVAICLFSGSLVGCAGTPAPAPEPIVKTMPVNVAVPVPCKALVDLGGEPAYADTDAAIKAAPDIFSLAQLYAKGRLQRIERLAGYVAARISCSGQ